MPRHVSKITLSSKCSIGCSCNVISVILQYYIRLYYSVYLYHDGTFLRDFFSWGWCFSKKDERVLFYDIYNTHAFINQFSVGRVCVLYFSEMI